MMENRSDRSKCAQVQQELSVCIKTGVPSFQRIQTDCVSKLKGYEDCLRKNANDRPTDKCFENLQDLRKCATGAINIKE